MACPIGPEFGLETPRQLRDGGKPKASVCRIKKVCSGSCSPIRYLTEQGAGREGSSRRSDGREGRKEGSEKRRKGDNYALHVKELSLAS